MQLHGALIVVVSPYLDIVICTSKTNDVNCLLYLRPCQFHENCLLLQNDLRS